MDTVDRRKFLELLATLVVADVANPTLGWAHPDAGLTPGRYRPGRIDNEYSLFLPGEKEVLRRTPEVVSIRGSVLTARLEDSTRQIGVGDQIDGWRLLAVIQLSDKPTAVFEKHVTHRGALVYVNERGVVAHIPKQIGQLSRIRPRPTHTPHGIEFTKAVHAGPDVAGEYILNSAEDPCYENMAALGAEYIGWTLVANEESGPRASLYLDASGRSRQIAETSGSQGLWAPDAAGAVFDPVHLLPVPCGGEYVSGYSKRTLLGGYLPVADVGVWDPVRQTGYESIVLLPLGKDSKPLGRIRASLTAMQVIQLHKQQQDSPQDFKGTLVGEAEQTFYELYWNGSAQEFLTAVHALWQRWQRFHEGAMAVEIPDEWLLNAARAGITLSRCGYTNLEPTYQIGDGAYTKVPPSSHALFPVAHYEFIWAQQLWNQCADADRYFQHYLDNYVLPNGDFVYNAQDQVEAPLNIGVVLANSARSYFYTRNVAALEKRLPVLERMLHFVLQRYEYSKEKYAASDSRHGLIWGSPEADLGDPHKDTPEAHPFFYQNAVWIWRGLEQHAKALHHVAREASRPHLGKGATQYEAIAREMRVKIEKSIASTLAASNPAMRAAGIAPFSSDDIDRDPTHLEGYENHRFMEDWFLADWGDLTLDRGHLRHRRLAGMQILGLGSSHEPCMTSNFMAHGTLSLLIRQDDYRPFLQALYALTCFAADSGSRYAPEDAVLPGGHPFDSNPAFWSAVVNSALQPTLGLRWLLCYEETDRDLCHLQKAAPKHWFTQGQRIAVRNCPTRFGLISWSTDAEGDRKWTVRVETPGGFSGDLIIHIHPEDSKPLERASVGRIEGGRVIVPASVFIRSKVVNIQIS